MLDAAIRVGPDQPDPYFNRGAMRRDRGDRAGALDDFRRALSLASVDWPPRAAAELAVEELERGE